MMKLLVGTVLVLFLGLTAVALWHHGYVGLFTFQFSTYAGMQVLADLVIALSLFLLWLWHDARQAGRNPWPWVVGTCLTGSIAPLLYVLMFKTKPLKDHQT